MRQTDNRMNHRVSEPQRSYGRIVRPRRQNKRGLLGFLLPFILLLAFFAGRAPENSRIIAKRIATARLKFRWEISSTISQHAITADCIAPMIPIWRSCAASITLTGIPACIRAAFLPSWKQWKSKFTLPRAAAPYCVRCAGDLPELPHSAFWWY